MTGTGYPSSNTRSALTGRQSMFDEFAVDGGQARPTWSVVPEAKRLRYAQVEAAQANMEIEPGRDVDVDERLTRSGHGYVPGLKRTMSMWLRLFERVQRCELGGAYDGRPTVASAQYPPGADRSARAARRTRPVGSHNGPCSRLPGGEAPVVSL